jgi:hypothetical protein
MKHSWQTICAFCLIILLSYSCREVYEPPAVKSENNFLVVDGTIVNGDDSTVIKLSRSRNLADSGPSKPELGQVAIVGGHQEHLRCRTWRWKMC